MSVQGDRKDDQGNGRADKGEAWLEARNKTKKATEQAILRRNAQLAGFHKTTYKEALQKAIEEQVRASAKIVHPLRKEKTVLINGGRQVPVRTTTKQQPDVEGWTKVRRKTKNTKPTAQHASSQQWRQDLLKQGKCFNCLQKGHTKFKCTRKIKCRLCNSFGHASNRCTKTTRINGRVKRNPTTFSNNQPINSNPRTQISLHKPSQIVTQEITHTIQTTITKLKTQPQEMDPLANWETMNLIDPKYFANKKPTEGRVFLKKRDLLKKRDRLLPANDFLERTAIVLTGPNQNTPTLAYRILRKLAVRFRMNPQHIKVRKAPPTIGDYLAIFPNADLRNRACDICAFDLGEGVQIQIARCVKNSGMISDPATHMARLKVHDIPHQFWTKEDLTDLVSGFGTLERMSDFPHNENYEELRVLVACYHPTHINEVTTATQEQCSVAMHFEMEGWLLKAAIQDLRTPQHMRIETHRGMVKMRRNIGIKNGKIGIERRTNNTPRIQVVHLVR